jgi:hypothetical protein
MPLIKMLYRPPVGDVSIEVLTRELPRIVAEALDCQNPDGRLVSADMEIEVGRMSEGMRSQFDLHIVVEANEYPERLANLDERRGQIVAAIRGLYGGVEYLLPQGFVWVRLCPGSFAQL